MGLKKESSVKVLTSMPNNLRVISRTHTVKGENQLPEAVF